MMVTIHDFIKLKKFSVLGIHVKENSHEYIYIHSHVAGNYIYGAVYDNDLFEDLIQIEDLMQIEFSNIIDYRDDLNPPYLETQCGGCFDWDGNLTISSFRIIREGNKPAEYYVEFSKDHLNKIIENQIQIYDDHMNSGFKKTDEELYKDSNGNYLKDLFFEEGGMMTLWTGEAIYIRYEDMLKI